MLAVADFVFVKLGIILLLCKLDNDVLGLIGLDYGTPLYFTAAGAAAYLGD